MTHQMGVTPPHPAREAPQCNGGGHTYHTQHGELSAPSPSQGGSTIQLEEAAHITHNRGLEHGKNTSNAR